MMPDPIYIFILFQCHSGKFIHDEQTNPVFYNEDNIEIDDPYVMSSHNNMTVGDFTVRSADGLIYKFEEKATTDVSIEQFWPSFIGMTAYFPKPTVYNYISAWHLTEIEDPVTSKKVTFEYTNIGPIWQSGTDLAVPTKYGLPSTHAYKNSFGSGTVETRNLTTTYTDEIRLSKINFDNGYIQFYYNKSREDHNGDSALTEIRVYDSKNRQQKRYVLTQDYAHIPGATTWRDKRLYLTSIQEYSNNGNITLPPYTFFIQ